MVNIRTAMTGCIMGVLSLPMSAQGIFNEMSFSADKTVFRLNAVVRGNFFGYHEKAENP